jgi:signal transduction histidine kinase
MLIYSALREEVVRKAMKKHRLVDHLTLFSGWGMDRQQYFPQNRAEFLIAAARLVLASFSLFAICMDPSEPLRYAGIAYSLLSGYVVYSLILFVLVRGMRSPSKSFALLTHILDLQIFSVFLFLTEAPTSPFFVYFVFFVMCAAIRWGWLGTAWTTAASLAAFIGMGVYAAGFLHDPDFELNSFIIRSVYLVVVAILLGYLGAYEQRWRGELSKLAAWPGSLPHDSGALVQGLLAQAASVLRISRAVMVWEEPEEPWRHLASWSEDQYEWVREPPDRFGALVPGPFAKSDFLCSDARSVEATVLYRSAAGFRPCQGPALHPEFQARFQIGPVLSLNLDKGELKGRLFLLDKKKMTSDDLILGSIVAYRVATSLEQFYLLRKFQHTAVAEERIRLARDLHDGLLQSLTGIAFRLQSVHRLMDEDLFGARKELAVTQGLLLSEQRALRCIVEELKPIHPVCYDPAACLNIRLEELSEYIRQFWPLKVEMDIGTLDSNIPEQKAEQIYFIVREAIVNAAKHSGASEVRAKLETDDGRINITVADNGRGFPFRGHYNHEQLTSLKLGPSTIKERVGNLGGTLSIESTENGACLKIALPLSGNRGQE